MNNKSQVEQLRWRKFQVLTDGFVCLADRAGDDTVVVRTARAGYEKGVK